MNHKKNNINKGLVPYVLLLLFIVGCLLFANSMKNKVNEFTYNEFSKYLNDGEISEIKIVPKVNTQNYEVTGKLKSYDEYESFKLYKP